MRKALEAGGIELNVFGVGVTILEESGDAEQGYVVTRLRCGVGAGAPPHRHAEREAFYVLEGRVRFMFAGSERELEVGEFIQVEPDELHAFHNAHDGDSVLLNMSMPAGHGAFFRAADSLFRSGGFSPEAAIALSGKHGIWIELPDGSGNESLS